MIRKSCRVLGVGKLVVWLNVDLCRWMVGVYIHPSGSVCKDVYVSFHVLCFVLEVSWRVY